MRIFRLNHWGNSAIALTLPVLILLASPLLAGEIRLEAPDEISELITPLLPEDAAPGKKLREMLSETLATEGYFSPVIDFNEDQSELKLKNVLRGSINIRVFNLLKIGKG